MKYAETTTFYLTEQRTEITTHQNHLMTHDQVALERDKREESKHSVANGHRTPHTNEATAAGWVIVFPQGATVPELSIKTNSASFFSSTMKRGDSVWTDAWLVRTRGSALAQVVGSRLGDSASWQRHTNSSSQHCMQNVEF